MISVLLLFVLFALGAFGIVPLLDLLFNWLTNGDTTVDEAIAEIRSVAGAEEPPTGHAGTAQPTTPAGYESVEALYNGTDLVIIGLPDDTHNCDAMGCGRSHVVLRVRNPPMRRPSELLQ